MVNPNLISRNRKRLSFKDIYLLFDAGGTTLFPNQDLMIRLANRAGIRLDHDELYHGYYSLIHQLDVRASVNGKFPENPWPNGYAYSLFESMEKLNPGTRKLAEEIEKHHKEKSLWTFTFPWVYDSLQQLRDLGYRMSILSNSDGRTRQILSELKLDRFFDNIYDSKHMKVSKPDPAIFRAVLKDLNLEPRQVVYIGDIYEVDIRGANKAGLGTIHLDPFGKYTHSQWPGTHIKTIQDLPEWLNRYRNGSVAVNIHSYPSYSQKRGNVLSKQSAALDDFAAQPCALDSIYSGVV